MIKKVLLNFVGSIVSCGLIGLISTPKSFTVFLLDVLTLTIVFSVSDYLTMKKQLNKHN